MSNLAQKYEALMGINRPAAYGIKVESYTLKEMRKDGFVFSEPQTKDWADGNSSTTVRITHPTLNFSCFAAVTNENFTVLEVRKAAAAIEKYKIKEGDCKGYLI